MPRMRQGLPGILMLWKRKTTGQDLTVLTDLFRARTSPIVGLAAADAQREKARLPFEDLVRLRVALRLFDVATSGFEKGRRERKHLK